MAAPETTLSERDGVTPGTFHEAEPRTFQTRQAVELLRFGQTHAERFVDRLGVDNAMQAKMQLADRILGIDGEAYSQKGVVTNAGLLVLLAELSDMRTAMRNDLDRVTQEETTWTDHERELAEPEDLHDFPYPDDEVLPLGADDALAELELADILAANAADPILADLVPMQDAETGATHRVGVFSDGTHEVLGISAMPATEAERAALLRQQLLAERIQQLGDDHDFEWPAEAEPVRHIEAAADATPPVVQAPVDEELEVVTDEEAASTKRPTHTLRFRQFGVGPMITRVIQLDEAGAFAPEEIAMLEEVAHHPWKHPVLHARLLRNDVGFAELDQLKLPYATRHIRHVERLAAAVPVSEVSDKTGGAYLVEQGILHPVTFEPIVVPNNPQLTADNAAIVKQWRRLMQQRRVDSGTASRTTAVEGARGGNIGISLGVLYAPLDGSAPAPEPARKVATVKTPVVEAPAPARPAPSELTLQVLATTNARALVTEKFGDTDDITVTEHSGGEHWTITARRDGTVFTFHMPKTQTEAAGLHYEGSVEEDGGTVEVFVTADHYVAAPPTQPAQDGPVERYLPVREAVPVAAEPPRRREDVVLPPGVTILGVEPTTNRRVLQAVTTVTDNTGTHEVKGDPYIEPARLSGARSGKQIRDEALLLEAFLESLRQTAAK